MLQIFYHTWFLQIFLVLLAVVPPFGLLSNFATSSYFYRAKAIKKVKILIFYKEIMSITTILASFGKVMMSYSSMLVNIFVFEKKFESFENIIKFLH